MRLRRFLNSSCDRTSDAAEPPLSDALRMLLEEPADKHDRRIARAKARNRTVPARVHPRTTAHRARLSLARHGMRSRRSIRVVLLLTGQSTATRGPASSSACERRSRTRSSAIGSRVSVLLPLFICRLPPANRSSGSMARAPPRPSGASATRRAPSPSSLRTRCAHQRLTSTTAGLARPALGGGTH